MKCVSFDVYRKLDVGSSSLKFTFLSVGAKKASTLGLQFQLFLFIPYTAPILTHFYFLSTCRHPNQAAAVEEPWYINAFFPERLPHGWALLLVGRPSLRPGVTTASGSMPFERPIKVTDRSWPNLSTRGAEHGAHNELQCLEVKSYISLLTVYLFSPPWLTFVKSLFSVQSCKHCVCMTHWIYVNMTNS